MDIANVRQNLSTWRSIARSFDATRRTPWPPVVEFLDSLPAQARLLDAGAGNGRHAAVAGERGLRVVGLDLSRELLRFARGRAQGLHPVQAALERLPLRGGAFDGVIAIATLHHVRGRPNRLEAWRELGRVLRTGAQLLVSVWSHDQPHLARPTGKVEPIPTGEAGDVIVWWSRDDLRVPRFYHLYQTGELETEARAAGLDVERAWSPRLDSTEDSANHFLLARRS